MARQSTWLLILLLIGLTGCASPVPPANGGSPSSDGEPVPALAEPGPAPAPRPRPPGSTAPTPALLSRVLYRATASVEEVIDGVTAIALEPWQQEVTVGSGDVRFTWQLDTHDAAAYRDRVRTSGATPHQVRTVLGAIEVTFRAPNPPDWTLWLEGIEGSRVSLNREQEPTAAVSYRHAEGELVPIEGQEAVLPPGRLEVVIQLDQAIQQQSVSQWRTHLVEMLGAPVILHGTGENQLTLEMSELPTRVELDLGHLVAERTGLPVSLPPITLWNRASLPYLERINLATGEAERLLTLGPDIVEALPSPAGRWIALRSWQRQGRAWRESRVDLVDLAQMRVRRAPLEGAHLRWAGDQLVSLVPGRDEAGGWESWNPLREGEPEHRPEPLAGAAFSPDGRWAAYLDGAKSGQPASPDGSAWYRLVLRDLVTGAERLEEGFVRGWLLGREEDFRLLVAWSPDGRRVAALDPVDPAGLSDLVVYDLELGERRVLQVGLPLSPQGGRLAWSPDGAYLAVAARGRETAVISLADGAVVLLDGSGHDQVFWDEFGRRLLTAAGPWEGVSLHAAADGSRQELGDGLPAGWSGESIYIIRWPGADARYRPSGQ